MCFVTGDMMALPFPDAAFDVVTTGYGIRNVPDIAGALREMHRVLRPGGLLLSLDFDRPASPAVRAVYLAYLTVVGSALGWFFTAIPTPIATSRSRSGDIPAPLASPPSQSGPAFRPVATSRCSAG